MSPEKGNKNKKKDLVIPGEGNPAPKNPGTILAKRQTDHNLPGMEEARDPLEPRKVKDDGPNIPPPPHGI